MSGAQPFYGLCPVCERPLEGNNLLLDGRNLICVWCRENGEDHTVRNPLLVAADQIEDAKEAIDREPSEYGHLPFRDLDALVGPVPPGDVGFLCGFSGQGKTTFVASMVARLLEANRCVYVVPLESEPKVFRTHLACKKMGLHAGKLLTGLYKKELSDGAWRVMRAEVLREIERQNEGSMTERLFVSPTRRMDVKTLEKNAVHAANVEADWFIIDHIDHIAGGNGVNSYAESAHVVDRVLDLTQEHGLKTLCTSQLNNEMVKHDPLGQYQCPRPHHVYMGGKKRQNAAWMLGIYRTLKLSGVDRDEMHKARSPGGEPWRVLEPNCMAAGLMKSRHFGEREGHRTYLSVRDGIVSDMDSLSLQAIEHGV